MGKKITLFDQIESASRHTIKARWPKIYQEIWEEGYNAGLIETNPDKKRCLTAAVAIKRQNEVLIELATGTGRNASKLIRELAGQPLRLPTCNSDQRLAMAIANFEADCIKHAPEGSRVSARNVYTTFKFWLRSSTGEDPPSQKRFGAEFGKRFRREKRAVIFYFGLRLSAKGRAFLRAGEKA